MKMISKKDALTLGVLAIGGVAIASSFAGAGDAGGAGGFAPAPRAGGILGSYKAPAGGEGYNIPAQAAVVFPEPPTFDFSKFFKQPEAPVSRGAAGVSAAPKKERIIYGGYMPSGKTYVFGGRAFEAQAAEEVTSLGYSPTLAAAFGITPEIAAGGAAPKKSQFDRLPSGCDASSSNSKGISGTALPGRPFISKKPE